MVFELDAFWGFDSGLKVLAMPAQFTTNYFYAEQPIDKLTLMSVLAEGSTRNIGDLTVTTSKNYEEASTDFANPQYMVLANESKTGLPLDYSAYADRVNVAETGRNVLIKFSNYNTTNQNTSETTYNITKVPQPGHYVQLLLVDYETEARDA